MKKILIYYFYLTDDFLSKRSNLINFECLRRYAHIFDEAKIFLSLDDTQKSELIREAEKVFVSIPFNGNISFHVVQNTPYRESRVIKQEILDKIDTLDSLVFFAHAKGFTNLEKFPELSEDMTKWIVGLYFLSLEYMQEVEDNIGEYSEFVSISFGSFPTIKNESGTTADSTYIDNIKYSWYYNGTFFWINTIKLYNYINRNNVKIPKMEDRFFSEQMLGEIFPYDNLSAGLHQRRLYFRHFYDEGAVTQSLGYILNDSEKRDFEQVYNEIMEKTNS